MWRNQRNYKHFQNWIFILKQTTLKTIFKTIYAISTTHTWISADWVLGILHCCIDFLLKISLWGAVDQEQCPSKCMCWCAVCVSIWAGVYSLETHLREGASLKWEHQKAVVISQSEELGALNMPLSYQHDMNESFYMRYRLTVCRS